MHRIFINTLFFLYVSFPVYACDPANLKSCLYRIDIPASSLSEALIEAGFQTKRTIVFEAEKSGGAHVAAISGEFTIQQLMDRLLQGLSLAYDINTAGGIRVFSGPRQQNNDMEQHKNIENVELPTVTVIGHQPNELDSSLFSDYHPSGSPQNENPHAVKSVSEDMLQSQNPQSISAVLGLFTGLDVVDVLGQRWETFSIRGFQNPLYSLDGYLSHNLQFVPDVAIIERVDVIKGPVAAIDHPGGLVNFVSKKPQDKTARLFQIDIADNNYLKAVIDTTGPLGKSPHSYRVIGSVTQQRNGDYSDDTDSYMFAPGFSWKLPNKLKLGTYFYYQKINDSSQIFSVNESMKIGSYNGTLDYSPEWDKGNRTISSLSVTFERPDYTGWSLTGAFHISSLNISDCLSVAYGFHPDLGDVYLLTNNTDKEYLDFGAELDIEKELEILGYSSSLRFGIDSTKTTGDIKSQSATNYIVYSLRAGNGNLSEPQLVPYLNQKTDMRRVGIHLLSVTDINDSLELRAGIRKDWIDRYEENTLEQIDSYSKVEGSVSDLLPNLGLSYRFNSQIELCMNYSESFIVDAKPSESDLIGADGQTHIEKIDHVKQLELTLNLHNLKKDLDGSISLFTVSQSDLETISYDVNMIPSYVDVPDARTRGVNLDILGKINSGWDILFGYNHIFSAVTPINVTSVAEPRMTPENTAHLWTTYKVLPEFRVGLGLQYIGKRYFDDYNYYPLSSNLRTDLGFYYRPVKDVDISLFIHNLFDEKYYTSAYLGSPLQMIKGSPRRVSLKMDYRF